ncbi:MAG: phosphopentomutase [Elusimicrobia bacterium]|nr:phosphopentomutase [Elusimicrobiota bacterium]
MKRAIIIVLDSVGVGEMPDAAKFNDAGADTVGHLAEKFGGLELPNLEKLGFGKIKKLKQGPDISEPLGCFGKMAEKSVNKDTTTGHWEMMGCPVKFPFPLYPNGFPDEIIENFKKEAGIKGILGNKAASGTEIIEELGIKHIETGYPIVYTSADSVFQIAAHNDVIPLDELYRLCQKAREILVPPHNVARVIARPFVGQPGSFERTTDRRDFSIAPVSDTLLDFASRQGVRVIGVGKIGDIFGHRGISVEQHTGHNPVGIEQTIDDIKAAPDCREIIFTNLVDFDTLYGHRRNPAGYYDALKEFDRALPEIMNSLKDDDILFITADHGCDPTYEKHTDHTREFVPLLVYGEKIAKGINLGVRETFSDVASTIAEFLGVSGLKHGNSFWRQINEKF